MTASRRSRLLEDAVIVSATRPPQRGSIAVEGNKIAAIGDVAALRARFPNSEIVDCGGRIAIPGLVNAHLHPELQLLKGIVEQLDLHAWGDAAHFDKALAVLSAPEGRELQRVAIRAALADAVLGGSTCIATYGVTDGADEVAAEVLTEIGVRGHVTIRDVQFEPQANGVATSARLAPKRMYRLHAEEALTPEELKAAAAAHARGERLVMHAAETEHRIALAITRFGTSTIRLLKRYDLLSERVLLSHAIYVDDEERELLAASSVPVVSSPTAEMKLSDGIAPVVDYLRRGVLVALGTDSCICNNSNDMFIEMRNLGISQKLRFGADSITAEQILLTATLNGARALGDAQQYGDLEPGLAADIVFVDSKNPRLQPLVLRRDYSNVIANLVFAATGQDVVDVMIDGEWVVRNRQLLTADAGQSWNDLADAATDLYEKVF